MEEALLWWGGSFGQLQSRGFAPGEGQIKSDRVSQHTAALLVAQGFVLKQDNDPKHTSRLCQKCIKSKVEQYVLQLISWPAQSVDLNPIELVWNELDWKVRAKLLPSAAHLRQLLQESWAELSSVYLQSLRERKLCVCVWFNLYFMWLRNKIIVELNFFH